MTATGLAAKVPRAGAVGLVATVGPSLRGDLPYPSVVSLLTFAMNWRLCWRFEALGGTSQFASSPDSEALRTIARLFTNASSRDGAVSSDVRDLPIKARQGLLRSTSAIKSAGWDIAGQIRQRGLGYTGVEFTQAGAALLASELKNYDYDTERVWAIGTIDGFRRSLGSLYFTPAGTKSAVAVNVSDAEILAAATRLAAEEKVVVRVLIETVRALSGEESTRMTTSRSLLQIERAAEPLPYPQ